MNITVYCGSGVGIYKEYQEAAVALGKWIADKGYRLIYGGGNIGLMGLVADTALAGGSHVTGVIPEFLLKHEHGHQGDFHLEIVETMGQRKARMLELGDIYIAMPGGVGTLEEISEAISLKRLGRQDKPCVFYDIKDYYQPLRQVFQNMVHNEFLTMADLDDIIFAKDINHLEQLLYARR